MASQIIKPSPVDMETCIQYGKLFWEQVGYDVPYDEQSVRETIQFCYDVGLFLIAKDDVSDRIYGMVGGIVSPLYANKDYWVGTELFFWVEPDARDRGIGMELMYQIERAAEEIGVHFWHMVAFDHLEFDKAASMYKRLGYKPAEHNFMKRLN